MKFEFAKGFRVKCTLELSPGLVYTRYNPVISSACIRAAASVRRGGAEELEGRRCSKLRVLRGDQHSGVSVDLRRDGLL